MSEKPNNVVMLRPDTAETVLQTLERVVGVMTADDAKHELGLLVVMNEQGRMEVTVLGTHADRCAAIGALRIAETIIMDEILGAIER